MSPWVYNMFCLDAHAKGRQSVLVREMPTDIDLAVGAVRFREKKRNTTNSTTRVVTLTPIFKEVVASWLKTE